MKSVDNSTYSGADFDQVAPFYNQLKRLVFGRSLEKAQSHFYHLLEPEQRILVVGAGTAPTLDKLLSSSGNLITLLDSSQRMLNIAEQSFEANLKVALVHADIFDYQTDKRFDGIILPFVLDLFPEDVVNELLVRISQILNPNGQVLFTDFQKPESVKNKFLVWSMYVFFRLFSGLKTSRIPNYDRAFTSAGFSLVESAEFNGGLVTSRVYVKK